MTDFYDIE